MAEWYQPKLTIHHVKAHTDEQANHTTKPEESANQDMDEYAKIACKSRALDAVQAIQVSTGWKTRMNGEIIIGHTKAYMMEKIRIQRSKKEMKVNKTVNITSSDEIAYRRMIGTKPPKCTQTFEAMQMWRELPTNDKTADWNICDKDECQCCNQATETNTHMIHECTNNRIIKLRKILEEAIINEYTKMKAPTTLIDIVQQLYGTDKQGLTHHWNTTRLPQEWKGAYANCAEEGHGLLQKLMWGLAAETVMMLGNSRLLMNGILTKAMVKTMISGNIQEEDIRKLQRKVRTHINVVRKTICQIRNECNFHEDVERERLNNTQMRDEIKKQIQHNEKAKTAKYTVGNIADMKATDRAKCFLNTTDNKVKQTRITDFGEQDKPTTTRTLRTQQYKTTNSQTLENLLGQ